MRHLRRSMRGWRLVHRWRSSQQSSCRAPPAPRRRSLRASTKADLLDMFQQMLVSQLGTSIIHCSSRGTASHLIACVSLDSADASVRGDAVAALLTLAVVRGSAEPLVHALRLLASTRTTLLRRCWRCISCTAAASARAAGILPGHSAPYVTCRVCDV